MSTKPKKQRGGHGNVATTEGSKSTDGIVRRAFPIAVQEIKKEYGVELFHTKTLTSTDFAPTPSGKIGSAKGDGGYVWYLLNGNKVLLLAGEAKHQGPGGNAGERWYYNPSRIRTWVEPTVRFLTFCTGYVKENGPLYRTMFPLHHGKTGSINKFSVEPGTNSVFLRETFTQEEVVSIVKQSLLQLLGLGK